MSSPTNFSTRDLSSLSPRLRDDLEIHCQDGGYVLEDPINGNFFSLGAVEYRFLQMLDGKQTLAEIVGRLSVEAKADALTGEAAISLLRVLIDSKLLQVEGREQATRVRHHHYTKEDAPKVMQQAKSIFFLRIPLGNPDRLLAKIGPYFSWLISPWFFMLWCGVVVAGAASVFNNWTKFNDELSGMFEVGNLFVLGLIWILLKVFHEGWHALVCKHFGGNVPEMGVVMLLFITPLGYVNATSATKFASKWQRIFVSFAGIYGELFIAGVAAIVWSQIDPGLMSKSLHEVIVISSVTTLLFNANPLMRFDGYYILADLSGVANLYSKAQRSAGFWFRRWFLGADPQKHPVAERDRKSWITLYGVAAFVWRILIVAGILAFVTQRWSGVGLVCGIFVGVTMLFSLCQSAGKYFQKSARKEGVSPGRTAMGLCSLSVAIGMVLALVQITPGVKVPAVVDWMNDGEIRVECPGFVEEVYVNNGDQVKKGDVLARIRNHDEESQLELLKIELDRLQISADKHLRDEHIAGYQSVMKQIAASKLRLAGLEKYVGSLELKASCDGVVFGRGLSNVEGTFVDKGQLLCTVGSETEKRLVLCVAEEESDVIQEATGITGEFRARGRLAGQNAVVSRVNPHASVRVTQFELIAPAGGPLVARRTLGESDNTDADSRIHGEALSRQFELAKPHFEAFASLDPEASKELIVGEIGYLKVSGGEQRSLWQSLVLFAENTYRDAGER